MNNELKQEELELSLENSLGRYKKEFVKIAEAAISDVYCGLLPHILEDTLYNAQSQAEDIVGKILSGSFNWDGDYIVVQVREYSPRVRIKFSAADYDSLRDAIIERMPACPKDAKIASLEHQLKAAWSRW